MIAKMFNETVNYSLSEFSVSVLKICYINGDACSMTKESVQCKTHRFISDILAIRPQILGLLL